MPDGDFAERSWAGQFPPVPQPIQNADIARLGERIDRVQDQLTDRLDKIVDTLATMATVQVNMANQERRIENLEERETKRDEFAHVTRHRLDKWINYGVGAWSVVLGAAVLWEKFHGF